MKKYLKIGIILLLMVPLVLSDHLGSKSEAAANPLLEVAQVRSTGEEAVVPVTIRNTTYLTSGHLSIFLSDGSTGVSLASFKPGDLFDNDAFRTTGNIKGNTLTVDFISNTGMEQKLTDNTAVIGYVTYRLSDQFLPGQEVTLNVENTLGKGRNNEDLKLQVLNGKIENRMPVGDVTGSNKVSVTGAIRILQHIKGDSITNREQFLSADVDADGILTQNDAHEILDYVTGKRTTFLAVAAKELANGVIGADYHEAIEARNGREPYQFKRKTGSLPPGLTLNDKTGELSGTPTRTGNYSFVVQVTDAIGDQAERQFTMDIIDSNILSVEKLDPVYVKSGETPSLPAQVKVTYKDKTTGIENVKWNPVDTSVPGTVTAKGSIGDTGQSVTVPVNVVGQDYIQKITDGYFELLKIRTIVIDTTADVYDVTVNNIHAHYEGNNQFSLASTTFANQPSVKVCLYDRYGNLLEAKNHTLPSVNGQ